MNLVTASNLASLRKIHGLSQETLAEKIGVSRQAVSKWERAESAPDTDHLIALAELYGISSDELLKGEANAEESTAKGRSLKRIIKSKQDAWGAIGAVIAIISFFLLGLLSGMWHIAWLTFLIIPIFYYIPIITSKK